MSNIKFLKNQNYEKLKLEFNEDNLFEDPYFPANDSSLFKYSPVPKGICWMRPHMIHPMPQFVVNGFGRCDMDQGYLGNCWFIAACVGIVQNKKLFAKVVPEDQNFTENYAGIFRFRFWQYGEWVEVVVDDRLPVWSDKRLVFCSNREEKDEFWGALLEKAYAKLNGSYENLESGQTFDALVDLSGGVQESFDLKKLNNEQQRNFWDMLNQSFLKETLMSCSINADNNVKEARLSNGLVKGHAFTITNLTTLQFRHQLVKLIRIKNPWGNNVEWKGSWSDYSREWDMISESKKRELNITKESDGEFWMSFDDFMYYFDVLQMCHLTIDSFSSELIETDDDSDLTWKCTTYHSEWIPGKSSGGSGQYNQAKYWTNPQFMVKLVDVDKDDNENKSTVIIALMQKNSRLKRAHSEESAEQYIQFRIYKIRDNVPIDETITTGLRLYANDLIRIGGSGAYINNREITQRFRVDPGYYLIIPSTYDEDVSQEFMLRIFTEQPIQTSNLHDYKSDLDEDCLSFIDDDSYSSYNSNEMNRKNNNIRERKDCKIM